MDGGDSSESPRPSSRCVDARNTGTPGGMGYRLGSNEAPTASARAPGASTTADVTPGATGRGIPSTPSKDTDDKSVGEFPALRISMYSPSVRGTGKGGEAITSEKRSRGNGPVVTTGCEAPRTRCPSSSSTVNCTW